MSEGGERGDAERGSVERGGAETENVATPLELSQPVVIFPKVGRVAANLGLWGAMPLALA
jgi:hypothetical protein